MEFLQPYILINLFLRRIVTVRSEKTSFLFFLLEDLKKNFLLNFWNSVDLFDHLVEDIHNGSDKVTDSCSVVESRVVKGSHEISLKKRNMLAMVFRASLNNGSVCEIVPNFVN
jgi:hypothetical protein